MRRECRNVAHVRDRDIATQIGPDGAFAKLADHGAKGSSGRSILTCESRRFVAGSDNKNSLGDAAKAVRIAGGCYANKAATTESRREAGWRAIWIAVWQRLDALQAA
jgi:hypothetical protein